MLIKMKTRIYAAPAVKGLILRSCFEQKGCVNPYKSEILVYKPWRPNGFFQLEIIQLTTLVFSNYGFSSKKIRFLGR